MFLIQKPENPNNLSPDEPDLGGRIRLRPCGHCQRLTMHRRNEFDTSSWQYLTWLVVPLLWAWQTLYCRWECVECHAGREVLSFNTKNTSRVEAPEALPLALDDHASFEL